MTEVDSAAVRAQHRYELLTWPEINEAVAQAKVIILPVGSIEQHGYHLPIDVDVKLASSVCYAAGERSAEDILVLPPMTYGYCNHVMDFPGTITIQPTNFINMLLDITKSVAYHGFKKIILVNGHGSNHPLVEQVGRQTNLTTDAECITLSWWQLVAEYWNKEVRTSGPGGCAHACELETSMYLHIDNDGVRKDRIDGEIPDYARNDPESAKWLWVDLTLGGGPVSLVSWTSSYARTGSFGNPELATGEKGEKAFNYAADQLVELARWFKKRPKPARKEHHAEAPTVEPWFGF
jgi:creatinine amidohydrolase